MALCTRLCCIYYIYCIIFTFIIFTVFITLDNYIICCRYCYIHINHWFHWHLYPKKHRIGRHKTLLYIAIIKYIINKHNEKQTILEELISVAEFRDSFSDIITKLSTACLMQLQRNKYRFKGLKYHFILCLPLSAHEY